MGRTKQKLRDGRAVFGVWVMIAHPTVVEIYAGERFDWICLDMEHTSIDMRSFHECVLAAKGTDIDLLVRLPSHESSLAKRVLDTGISGIIVPNVTVAEEARRVVAMAKYPPEGNRGASLARCTDFGRNFKEYVANHNDNVIVAVMLEHIDALDNLDSILSVSGIDATFIGPYDLSTSMGVPGQLEHPKVVAAQSRIVEACRRHGIPAGYHVVQMNAELVQQRLDEGFRFIGCGLDTEFIQQGCRSMIPASGQTLSLHSIQKKAVP